MTVASTKKTEIQGLRGIAVLIVVFFHLWPTIFTGGYIGVDVFFVISGYLITNILLREINATGTINLTAFYGRRVRRLMPAAGLVILFCAFSAMILPVVQWPLIAKDLLASTFYVQNWWLIEQSVDYLAQGHMPSVLQHYWSLSVEEQYYILWPVLLLTMLRFNNNFSTSSRAQGWLILIAGILSLWYSVELTYQQQEHAYFSTFTRLWELALGGLLAAWNLPDKFHTSPFRILAGWLGLIMVVIAAMIYTKNTVFPGWTALLPTVGSVLVILAGDIKSKFSANYFLSWKPFQFLGDISYSLYLWHWPIILIYTAVTGHAVGTIIAAIILLISLVLAYYTKIYVEDRFRLQHSVAQRFNSGGALKISTTYFTLALVASFALQNYYEFKATTVLAQTQNLKILQQYAQQPYDANHPTIPDVINARSDNPELYQRKCHVRRISSTPHACVFGEPNANRTLMLVGDSHAAQWLPTLQALGYDSGNWRIITHTKSSCPYIGAQIVGPKGIHGYQSCSEWNKAVMKEILLLEPDIVVTSMSHYLLSKSAKEQGIYQIKDAVLSAWQPILDKGIQIVGLKNTPVMGRDIPECLSSPFGSPEKCTTRRNTNPKKDAVEILANSLTAVGLIDVTNKICESNLCSPLKGQILIWRDSNHLTATFARYLAPYVRSQLNMQDIPVPQERSFK